MADPVLITKLNQFMILIGCMMGKRNVTGIFKENKVIAILFLIREQLGLKSGRYFLGFL